MVQCANPMAESSTLDCFICAQKHNGKAGKMHRAGTLSPDTIMIIYTL